MNIFEAILATIGAWLVTGCVLAAVWALARRHYNRRRRRGGLVDLTRAADTRKNAREREWIFADQERVGDSMPRERAS